jgi:hypothetical protein
MSIEILLSPKARAATIDVVKAETAGLKKYRALADVYHADGIRAEMLETEKNGGNVSLRTDVKLAITFGLTEAEQKIIAADVKTLDAVQKTARNDAKDKVEKYLGKIRKYLKDDESDGTGDAKETKTEIQRIQKMLDDALTKIQKLENPAFNVVDVVKLIKTAKGAMPAV